MADTPVDTVDTTATEAAPAESTAPGGAAPAGAAPESTSASTSESTSEEKPAKKAAAKKAAAKKAPARKTAAKKAPAKKTAAKKSTAVKADAETSDVEARSTTDASDRADDAASTSGTAVLFQPPAKKAPAKKTKPKPKAEPADGDQAETSAKADKSERADQADQADQEEDADTGATRAKKAPAKKASAKKPPKVEPVEDDEDATDSDESDDSDAEQGEGGEGGGGSSAARRRRRRGGRRRRKPGGGGAAGEANDDADADSDESDDSESKPAGDAAAGESTDADAGESDAEGGEQGEGGSSSSSRRRRRRRREGEGGSDSDDTTTVTRVRKPRSAEDEITSISGSTRLEAKKQRRRDGREAGRRRAPIVSEAEFLARRESVDRVMVVRQRKDLTQIAVLEDKVLVEHYVARESQTSLIGNVYLGRVQNVLPSMEAAFIDIGKGRNAVLYAGEVNWSALGHKDGQPRKIESVLQSGQPVLVQVTKDPIGHKGARLTSQVSLAGRFLVYVPDGTTSGISRKLPDTERGRLKTLLKEIVPETAGVIVRTAAEGASEDELTRDVERLKARWEDIEKKVAKGNAPQLLYGEPDLTLKVVRDLFTEDFAKLVVQGDDAWETVHDYVEHMAPDLADRLEHYGKSSDGGSGRSDKPDVFASYRIDEQIAKGLDRKVWLPSGGSLVIDRTEAMTVVDVNTGKFTGSGGNLEETVTKNNLEAAEEIVRQLRLRDIGGIIVVDFIDMVLESNRDLVLRRLVECLGRDRTRHQVAEVTSLGLIQMTRKRIGTGLLEAFSETCDHCQGRGIVVHDLPVEPRRGGGGGDDDARGNGRRRRGKGGGRTQAEEPAAKAVPSPKDVAAMAKPPAPGEDEDDEALESLESLESTEVTDDAVAAVAEAGAAEAGETTADAATDDRTPDVEVVEAATVEAVEADGAGEPAEVPEPAEAPEPAELVRTIDAVAVTEADEPTPAPEPQAPVEPAAPKVVTRTRRSSASRPAGPPSTISTPVVPEAEAAAEAPVEEPHVEHVPIKKKGTRKR